LAIIKSMHHIDIVAADIQDFNRILRKSAGKINRTHLKDVDQGSGQRRPGPLDAFLRCVLSL
jgi:hypothetical protein